MASLEVPKLVRQYGVIAPCWKAIDLEMLHRATRQGRSLAEIAQLLPCLWFYQPQLRGQILERCVEGDSRIASCVHPNVGPGEASFLNPGESDAILSAVELRDLDDQYAEFRNELLKLPQVDYEIVMERMAKLVKDLREWNAKAHIKASKRLELHERHPQPRKRSGKYGVEEEQPKLEKST